MHAAYTSLLQQPGFGLQAGAATAASLEMPRFGNKQGNMLALQKKTLELARRQLNGALGEDGEDTFAPAIASQVAEATPVPLPLAMHEACCGGSTPVLSGHNAQKSR